MPAPGYRSREWKRKNQGGGIAGGIVDAVSDVVDEVSDVASGIADQAASTGQQVARSSARRNAARRRRRLRSRARIKGAKAKGRSSVTISAAQTISEARFAKAERKRQATKTEREKRRKELAEISGLTKERKQLRERQRERNRARNRLVDVIVGGAPKGKLNKTLKQRGQRLEKTQVSLKKQANKNSNTITNTAVNQAMALTEGKEGRKRLPLVKRALKTQQGRTTLVTETLRGDLEATIQQGAPGRFTGTISPFRKAEMTEGQIKQREELLRRKAQQVKTLENQWKKYSRSGKRGAAQATARQYQREVNEYKKIANQANRLSQKAQKQSETAVKQVAAGKWEGIINLKGKGAKTEIEMPSETFQKDQVRNAIEEGFGLSLSPADVGMAAGTGFVGRGAIGGLRAAVAGAQIARKSENGAKLVPAAIAGLQSTNTNTGRIGAGVLKLMSGKTGRNLYRLSVVGSGAALIGGKEYTFPFVEGAIDAVDTPAKAYATGKTTFRNVLGSVAALPTLGANLAVTMKRAGAAPFAEDEYKREMDYITAPTVQLAEATWQELRQMFDVYTSKDPDVISKATQEDYGIGPVFSAYYLLRPFTKGIRRAVSSTGDFVTLPAFGTTQGLAEKLAGNTTNVKGVRFTTLPAREKVVESLDKVEAKVEKVVENMPDYLSNALPFQIGFRNPFTRPDVAPMMGRETIREIGSRRRATATVFLAKNRSEAMESTMNTQAGRPARQAVQWYNGRAISATDRGAYRALEKRMGQINERWSQQRQREAPYSPNPRPVTIPDLVNELVTRGLHADRDGNITIDYRQIREVADGMPEGSVGRQRLEAILELPRVFDPESKERGMFVKLAIGIDRSHQILSEFRRQGIIEQYGEDTPEAQAKLDAERNSVALETVIAYEQMTGRPAPARPELAIPEILAERRAILDDENLDLATKKKAKKRLDKQVREAVQALYNRDLQDRARIRATGVRGRLTRAGNEHRKLTIRTRVNEATEWLLTAGEYRQHLTQRLRQIAGELRRLETERGKRKERVGELRQREGEERRSKRKGPTPLTTKEKEALGRWVEEGDNIPTQEALRGIRQSRTADQTRPFLESAIYKQVPTTRTITVLKQFDPTEGFEINLDSRNPDGGRATGFVSTTRNTDLEGQFSVLIRIQPGSYVLDVPKTLGRDPFSEQEVLLPPGTRFAWVDETEDGKLVYEAITPRSRQADPEAVPGTRDLAEQVMRDQIDGEEEARIAAAALRAERKELQRQKADIERHEKQMRIDRKLLAKAEAKVTRLVGEMESKVNEALRTKAGDLQEEKQALADEIVIQQEGLAAFSREMRAALTKEELEAEKRRVEEEVMAEYGPDITNAAKSRALKTKRKAKERELEGITRELDSHKPLTREGLAKALTEVDELIDAIADTKAELAIVLMALKEGKNREASARAFEAIQEGMPERPSGKPYKPGEMGAPTIEGRSQVVTDLLNRIEKLEKQKEEVALRIQNHDVELPNSVRKDLEASRSDAIKAIGEYDNQIRRIDLVNVPPASTAKIIRAKTRAAIGVATQRKKEEILADEVEARQALYDQYIEEAYESGLGEAYYVTSIEAENPDDLNITGPSVEKGLGMPYEKQRTGRMIASGNVDRGIQTLFRDIATESKRQARQRTTQVLMSQAVRVEDPDGNQQTEFTQEEAQVLADDGAFDRTKFTWLPTSMLYDPRQYGSMIDALMGRGASRGEIDAYVKEQVPSLEADEVRLAGGEQRLAEKFLAEGGGLRGVLVPNQSIKIIIDSERKLNGVERILYGANKVASRLVLGTSVSWMLAQPIAEFLILVMDQANPARLTRAYKRVRTLRKTEEGRRVLALLSGSSYGMARDLRGPTRIQQDYNQAMKELDVMPITSIAKEAVKLETLGNVDRWKGAWIREIGAVAELDREQSNFRRAAKAFLDQKDAIEEAAGKLAKMTPEEQVLWTGTAEGMAVANQIAKNIDNMLGNWTDVRPGFETAAGSLVFFYPFIRFSLRWTFVTYPRRHPVRAALAQIYGAINAEMLEQWLDFDPAWVSDWAAAPIFGGDEDQPISSLVGLNRVSPSGNAFIEYGALSENPFFTMTKVAPPWLGIIGRAMFGRDPYGQPLVDPGSPFGINELPGAGTVLKQILDEGANLIAPLRSLIRYTGFTPSEVVTKGDFPWELLGDVPGLTTKGKNLIAAKGPKEQNSRYQGQLEIPAPGDDQNLVRDLFRRELFAMIPKPAHYYQTEQKINRLFELRTAAQKDAEYPYPDVMYRGQLKSLAEAAEQIAREKREALETVNGISKGWRPTSQQKAYQSKKEKIREIRDNGERIKENVEKAIQNTYRDNDLPMGLQNKIRRSVLDRKRQEQSSLRRDWEEKVGGEWWAPKKYPGDRQAEIDLNEIKRQEDTENGITQKSGPVNTAGKFVAAGKATPRRKKLISDLRAGTRARLEKAGMRRVDLTDPTLDPNTVTKKTKEGNLVVSYRGKKVLGKVTIGAVRQAENDATLDLDEDGRLTIPQTRQAVARVEAIGEKVTKKQRQLNQLMVKAGGVPAKVPEKYRASIRKWGAWLEKEMKKNGLVQPYNTAIMDGYGVLPKGMSGAEYLSKIIQAESGWDENIGSAGNTSYAGAMGLGQFIPGTRQSVLDDYGVDAYGDSDQQIHAAAILLSKGGMENYNSLFPNSSDDPVGKGGYHYYYEQDVGKMILPNKKAAQQLKGARSQLSNLQKQFEGVAKMARNMGINVNAPGTVGPIKYPGKQAKQLNGAWAGTERLLDMANGGEFSISSEKRDYNTVSGGLSDHYTGATGSYAHDLPTTDDGEAEEMMRQYYNRLKLNEPLEWGPGQYKYYTSRKYPGYVFQMLWKSDEDHYDHVHIGAKWTGDDLPGGTFYGAGAGSSAPSSGGGYVGGGGGGVAAGGMTGGGGAGGGGTMLWQDADGQRLSLSESQSDMEPIYAAEQMAELGGGDGENVESIQQALASLPSVKARKKKSLTFDPKSRI